VRGTALSWPAESTGAMPFFAGSSRGVTPVPAPVLFRQRQVRGAAPSTPVPEPTFNGAPLETAHFWPSVTLRS